MHTTTTTRGKVQVMPHGTCTRPRALQGAPPASERRKPRRSQPPSVYLQAGGTDSTHFPVLYSLSPQTRISFCRISIQSTIVPVRKSVNDDRTHGFQNQPTGPPKTFLKMKNSTKKFPWQRPPFHSTIMYHNPQQGHRGHCSSIDKKG